MLREWIIDLAYHDRSRRKAQGTEEGDNEELEDDSRSAALGWAPRISCL